MEFTFTEEQLMIRETAASFLAAVSSGEAVRRAMATTAGFDAEVWQRITSEMYWQALHIPEQYGGLGLGYVELVAILEQMGRHLLCAPFFSTVCLATNALLIAGSEAQKAEYLPRIAQGSLTATLGYAAGGRVWDAKAIKATCNRDGDGYRLNGEVCFVPDGHTAQLMVVAARALGSSGADGVSLFLVPADTPGLVREWTPTLDQTRKLARVRMDDVIVPPTALIGEEGRAWPALAAIIDLASVAVSAEQAGGAQQVLAMSVDYTQEREQFGRSIASFQVTKHKAADMMLRAEGARSAVYYAACVAQDYFERGKLAGELPEAASIAKSYCSDACFANAGEALQMFGGVGFTWEYDIQLYFKRAKSDELFLGNGAWHRERLAGLLLDSVEAAS